uniref:hypothetical protein n=1 Tax=Cupriavidus yeoncheonensis TaxID=1462994 RepID=UPI003F4910A9
MRRTKVASNAAGRCPAVARLYGLETNTLRPSIVASGLDPANLPADMTRERADALYGSQGSAGIKRWRDIWSAGHSVSGVGQIESVRELVVRTQQEFHLAREAAYQELAAVASGPAG